MNDAFTSNPGESMAISDPAGFDPKRLLEIGKWTDELTRTRMLAGASVFITKRGALAYSHHSGFADLEQMTPMSADTLVRVKSMTKPMTSVAALTLYEDGKFELDDPISDYCPAFKNQKVFVRGTGQHHDTVAAKRDISFRDLLTHTSGLTYGFMQSSPVDELYRDEGVDFQLDSPLRDGPPVGTLAEMVERAAAMPLLFQPGSSWSYSIATDVLAHLIEVLSGQTYTEYMQAKVFGPIGMSDTSFQVEPKNLNRFAAHYAPGEEGVRLIESPRDSRFARPITLVSGGGGAISTGYDYLKFCQMILNGGSLRNVRVLSQSTIKLMSKNHLVGGDIASWGTPRLDGERYNGIGFGLGLSVLLDPRTADIAGSVGQAAWWGSASTFFWLDPKEELAVVFLTQLTPSSTYPLRRDLRSLVYRALA